MDLSIAIFINKLGEGTFLDTTTKFISSYLFLIALWTALIIAILFFDKKNRKTLLITILIAIALHFLISEGFFKILLATFFKLRVRPYLAHPDLITALGTNSTDSSFPSNHMSSTVSILTVFVYFYKKYWIVWTSAVLFTILMAFSRTHNGMHYPTDILAGIALGIVYGTIAIKSQKLL
jgi:undecaprenyl-diphosphatase